MEFVSVLIFCLTFIALIIAAPIVADSYIKIITFVITAIDKLNDFAFNFKQGLAYVYITENQNKRVVVILGFTLASFNLKTKS